MQFLFPISGLEIISYGRGKAETNTNEVEQTFFITILKNDIFCLHLYKHLQEILTGQLTRITFFLLIF